MTIKKIIKDYYNTTNWTSLQRDVYVCILFYNFDLTLKEIGYRAGVHATVVSNILNRRRNYNKDVNAIQEILLRGTPEMIIT